MNATPLDHDAAAETVGAGEAIGGIGIGDFLRSMRKLGRGGVHRVVPAVRGLAGEYVRIVRGRSEITPEKADWRFKDPAFSESPVYRRLMQAYLAWCEAMLGLVEGADMEWRDIERATFYLNMVVSAAAPTNTLAGNPGAIKRLVDTAGISIARGSRHMVHDLLHNGGLPSQVDSSPFVVGANLAVSPGAVVYRDEVCEVLQYTPTTTEVRARPLVMIPPQINKYYFMDLAPGRSFVEHAVSNGFQFFVISWRNPGPRERDWDLDTYGAAVLRAIDVARDITGSDDVNVLGLCAGGILTSTVLNHLAATNDDRVHTASFGVTLLDFEVPAMLGLFDARPVISLGRWRSGGKAGVLSGKNLASVFTWLRPNDLVWNYWVNNYLMGNKPPAFDILAWNADTTDLPAALHSQFLEIFHNNVLSEAGVLTVLGSPVDLSRVRVETYVTGALTDHLTPWRGCYRTTQLMSGKSTFILSRAGHIASLVNPPGNPKSHYFAGPEPGPDPDEWQANATQHQGTWWEHWTGWINERSGRQRAAPRRLGSDTYPVLGDAPGLYVRGLRAPRP